LAAFRTGAAVAASAVGSDAVVSGSAWAGGGGELAASGEAVGGGPAARLAARRRLVGATGVVPAAASPVPLPVAALAGSVPVGLLSVLV
jgi:hypothetical protein